MSEDTAAPPKPRKELHHGQVLPPRSPLFLYFLAVRMMQEPPCEEPLRLCHLPLGGVAKDAFPKVREASRKSRLCGRNCNSALSPPHPLLTFSGRKAKKKKLESFCNQGDRRQLLVSFFLSFFACLPCLPIWHVASGRCSWSSRTVLLCVITPRLGKWLGTARRSRAQLVPGTTERRPRAGRHRSISNEIQLRSWLDSASCWSVLRGSMMVVIWSSLYLRLLKENIFHPVLSHVILQLLAFVEREIKHLLPRKLEHSEKVISAI